MIRSPYLYLYKKCFNVHVYFNCVVNCTLQMIGYLGCSIAFITDTFITGFDMTLLNKNIMWSINKLRNLITTCVRSVGQNYHTICYPVEGAVWGGDWFIQILIACTHYSLHNWINFQVTNETIKFNINIKTTELHVLCLFRVSKFRLINKNVHFHYRH